MGRVHRKKYTAKQTAGRQSLKEKLAYMQGQLAKWDELIAVAEGSRKYSYMMRRAQLSSMIKRLKAAIRGKKSTFQATQYVLNPKGMQGGAPGLRQQGH